MNWMIIIDKRKMAQEDSKYKEQKGINESSKEKFPFKFRKINCSIDEYIEKNGELRLNDYGEWIDQVFNKLHQKMRDE